jgi:hypothetical protein
MFSSVLLFSAYSNTLDLLSSFNPKSLEAKAEAAAKEVKNLVTVAGNNPPQKNTEPNNIT